MAGDDQDELTSELEGGLDTEVSVPGVETTITTTGRTRKIPTLSIGDRVGDYLLRGVLGSGGLGTVYKAQCRRSGDLRAVKVLKDQHSGDPRTVERLRREACTAGWLDHPGVAHVYEWNVYDGQPYIAMEFLSGVDLNEHILTEGRIAPSACLQILRPLCEVLEVAHDQGVVHRDIKASNIFLNDDPERRVVLLDFGIAKIVRPDVPSMTRSHEMVGTTMVAAPEQLYRNRTVDGRADIYAFGALLFRMLAGVPIYHGLSPYQVEYRKLMGQRPRLSEKFNMPSRVDEVIGRCMAVDPADRYLSTTEFLSAAAEALAPMTDCVGPRSPAPAFTNVDAPEEEAIGLYLALVVPEEVHAEGDEAAFDQMESVLMNAEAYLKKHGFDLAVDVGDSRLFVQKLSQFGPEGDPMAQDMNRILDGMRNCLSKTSEIDSKVEALLSVHVAPVESVPGGWEGPLLDLGSWLPQSVGQPISVTRHAARVLNLETH